MLPTPVHDENRQYTIQEVEKGNLPCHIPLLRRGTKSDIVMVTTLHTGFVEYSAMLICEECSSRCHSATTHTREHASPDQFDHAPGHTASKAAESK